MKTQICFTIICWLVGSIIWAFLSWISFSEGNDIIGWVQVVASIGLLNAIVVYCKHKKKS